MDLPGGSRPLNTNDTDFSDCIRRFLGYKSDTGSSSSEAGICVKMNVVQCNVYVDKKHFEESDDEDFVLNMAVSHEENIPQDSPSDNS